MCVIQDAGSGVAGAPLHTPVYTVLPCSPQKTGPGVQLCIRPSSLKQAAECHAVAYDSLADRKPGGAARERGLGSGFLCLGLYTL